MKFYVGVKIEIGFNKGRINGVEKGYKASWLEVMGINVEDKLLQ